MTLSLIISIFITLFIVVDPLGLIPVFVSYLPKYGRIERRRIILKTIVISIVVSVIFIFSGKYILLYLGVSPGAFLIAGGILLFIISIDLIISRPLRSQMSHRDSDNIENMEIDDISVVPLAIPMISGPGYIAALIMFSSQKNVTIFTQLIILIISIIIFIFTMIVMFLSGHFERLIGKTGISVVQRIMGLVLSALAVQFIINGIRQVAQTFS